MRDQNRILNETMNQHITLKVRLHNKLMTKSSLEIRNGCCLIPLLQVGSCYHPAGGVLCILPEPRYGIGLGSAELKSVKKGKKTLSLVLSREPVKSGVRN